MFSNLTDAAIERMSVLTEECGESVQIAGKVVRHGWLSYHPEDVNKTVNRQLLEKELGDVLFAMRLLGSAGDISLMEVERHSREKAQRIGAYLHHNTVPEELK